MSKSDDLLKVNFVTTTLAVKEFEPSLWLKNRSQNELLSIIAYLNEIVTKNMKRYLLFNVFKLSTVNFSPVVSFRWIP